MTGSYNIEDKSVMINATKAQNKSRLQELIDFAKISGFTRLGIATCKVLQSYADKLAELLKSAGFEVYTINCRESGLDSSIICEEMSGSCCDPLSQADYLNSMQTELNIEVGLCLGHGLLFRKYSKAMVTTFLVKDFVTKHKTIQNLE